MTVRKLTVLIIAVRIMYFFSFDLKNNIVYNEHS